jgi:hypothetical protein
MKGKKLERIEALGCLNARHCPYVRHLIVSRSGDVWTCCGIAAGKLGEDEAGSHLKESS